MYVINIKTLYTHVYLTVWSNSWIICCNAI